MRDPEHKREPVEIVLIGLPILIEIVAVCLFIAAAVLWAGIGAGRI
jgi:hypothetical protein